MAFYVVTFTITLFFHIESGFVDLVRIVDFLKIYLRFT